MVVAFYSPMHGQAGTTSNMLSIALLLTLKFNKKICLMEGHFKKNALESMLIKRPNEDEFSYFEDFGIDLMIRGNVLSQSKEERLLNSSFSFLNNQIHLLPGTRQVNQEIFEESIQPHIIEIIEIADQCHDMVFIDMNASKDRWTNQILKRADLIVVNISQNPWLIQQFDERSEQEKFLYLIGNYDKKSQFNQTNLRYLFPFLSKKNTIAIPYNVIWRDAIYDARSIHCMRKMLPKETKRKNQPYIKAVSRACAFILRKEGESGD